MRMCRLGSGEGRGVEGKEKGEQINGEGRVKATVERAQPQICCDQNTWKQGMKFTPDTQPKTTECPVGGLLIQWHCVGPL